MAGASEDFDWGIRVFSSPLGTFYSIAVGGRNATDASSVEIPQRHGAASNREHGMAWRVMASG